MCVQECWLAASPIREIHGRRRGVRVGIIISGGMRRRLALLVALVVAMSLATVLPRMAWAAIPYAWTSVTSDVTPARADPSVASDGASSPAAVLLFGGKTSAGPGNETWRWSGGGWS